MCLSPERPNRPRRHSVQVGRFGLARFADGLTGGEAQLLGQARDALQISRREAAEQVDVGERLDGLWAVHRLAAPAGLRAGLASGARRTGGGGAALQPLLRL